MVSWKCHYNELLEFRLHVVLPTDLFTYVSNL